MCNNVVKVNLELGMDSFHRDQYLDPRLMVDKEHQWLRIDMIINSVSKNWLTRELVICGNLLPGIKPIYTSG
jgi:hypothetical protein